MDKELIENKQPEFTSEMSQTVESQPMQAEMVNHPMHYNNYNVEVIDMMERIWGTKMVAMWCLLTSYKYRMRMGTKPGESIQRDLEKEQWYLKKAAELKEKLNQQKKN